MRFHMLMIAALACPISAIAGDAPGAQSIDGYFKGWAEIDASGRLQAFAPDGQAHAAIAQALHQELQRAVFKPARTDAGPAAVRTYLLGSYRLVAEGEDYALQLKSFHAGPKPLTIDMPHPPRRLVAMDEASWVRASLVIDRNGRARDVVIDESGGASELRRNVAKSIPRWRFEPESIAGAPIETAMRQQFLYYLHDKPRPSPPPCPADTSGRVLAPGQTPCQTIEFELGESQMGRTITVP